MLLIDRLITLKFSQLTRILGSVAAVLWALLVAAPHAAAQIAGSPFNCDVVFYQVRSTGTPQSQLIKFASVNATITPTAVYTGVQGTALNAIGYNPVDNYIYGLNQSINGPPQLYRAGSTGYELVGVIANSLPGGTSLATFTPTAGVFDAAGRYYFAGQNTNIVPASIFRIDTIPISGAPQVSHQYNLTPTVIVNFGDFDFNGAGGVDGLLLASTQNIHYRLSLSPSGTNPVQGTASVEQTAFAAAGNVGGIGSAFYDAFAGKFYVFNNGTFQFWEIQNPQSGVPSAVATSAVAFTGAPAAPYSATDGTSCPISGSRRADLAITKDDNLTSLPQNSVTSYVITVTNRGPYPANYAVVRDPPAAGLQKLSVTCSAPGGPPSAVCPATLSTTTFEAGVQVITFPPQTTLVFTVNALVTATAGSFVTNTASVTPAIDTVDGTLTNNVAIDVDAVTVTATTVISAASICPAGTNESVTSLFSNGDFSAASPFASGAGVTVGTLNSYNTADSVSRQTGLQTYAGAAISQNPFSGDSARSVPGSNSWLLSNGKAAAANYSVWEQPVTGLVVGRVYEFMTYQSNAVLAGQSRPTLPDLRLQVSTGLATTTITPSTPLATETVSPGDTWRLVQGTFTATVSAVTLSIVNFAAASAEPAGGDVAGLAQVTLRACNPAADAAVTKTNGASTLTSGGTTTYTITVVNLTSGINATNTLIVDPGVANLSKNTITCVATAGSSCPAALSILGFEGAGLTIPLIVGLGTVTFNVAATVTGPPGNSATNIVTVSGVGYTDPNPANNQAQDSDPITGTASLSVTKSNGGTTLTAGSTTTYTVTVSLTAGAQVVGAVLKDPVAAGLSCTAVTCTGVIGAATCPSAASTTIAALQGAGIVLPSMTAPSSIIFAVTCGITATGQ